MDIVDGGMVVVRVTDQEGKEFTRDVDLFEFTSRVWDMARDVLRSEGGDVAYYEGMRKILSGMGFPPMSGAAMHELRLRMDRLRADVKKKHDALRGPESPDSTDSTPGG